MSSSTATRTPKVTGRRSRLCGPRRWRSIAACPRRQGTRDLLLKARPEEICRMDAPAEAPARHGHHAARRAPIADGHAGAHLRHAGRCRRHRRARHAERLFSLEMWGGATFDTRHAVPERGPVGPPAPVARAHPQHLLPDAVPRFECGRLLELSRERRRRVREACGGLRHRHLPHLRFAELPAEPSGRDGSGAGDARHLRGGDLLHRRHPRSEADEVLAQILREAGEGAGTDGRAFPGDQGHGRPVPAVCGVASSSRR